MEFLCSHARWCAMCCQAECCLPAAEFKALTSRIFLVLANAGGASGGVGGAVWGVAQLGCPRGFSCSLQPCAAHHHRQHVLPCDSGCAAAGSLFPPRLPVGKVSKALLFLGSLDFLQVWNSNEYNHLHQGQSVPGSPAVQ